MTISVPDFCVVLGISFILGSAFGYKLFIPGKDQEVSPELAVLHLDPDDITTMKRFALAMHFNSLERLQQFSLCVLDWYIGNRQRGWTICAFNPVTRETEQISSRAYDPDPLDFDLGALHKLVPPPERP